MCKHRPAQMPFKGSTPSNVTGTCRLCRRTAPLCDSHLVPAALYRLLRSTTVTPREPLLITSGVTMTTSRQMSAYLLCIDCEDRFRTRGENWVLRHCYRGKGRFRLRELVVESTPLDTGVVGTFYSAKSNPKIDARMLTYFAASVFWRAAVHRWKYLNVPASITLGVYEEQFRMYLLDEAQFPKAAAMWVWVSSYKEPSRALSTPHSARQLNCHLHSFDIPGMRFTLVVGQAIPDWARFLCVLNGQDQPVLVSDAPDDILATDVHKMSQTTHLSDRLQGQGKWSWTRPL
jgi:hypothetical protein